jgi:hypothetical protein
MFSAGKSNEKKDKDSIVTISTTLEKSYAPRPVARAGSGCSRSQLRIKNR